MKNVFLAVLLVLLFAAAAFAVVNINTASKEELNSLPGIGAVKAEAIIKYRQEKGAFKSVDDLKNVYGIGDKLFEQLKSDITIDEPKSAAPSDKAATEVKEVKSKAEEPKAKVEEVPPSAEKKNVPPSAASQK